MRRRQKHRPRIRQRDVDFLCLAVFGERALPDDMACRIREFREFTMHGLEVAFERSIPDPGPAEPETVEAVAV